jgi:hypothetical protein
MLLEVSSERDATYRPKCLRLIADGGGRRKEADARSEGLGQQTWSRRLGYRTLGLLWVAPVGKRSCVPRGTFFPQLVHDGVPRWNVCPGLPRPALHWPWSGSPLVDSELRAADRPTTTPSPSISQKWPASSPQLRTQKGRVGSGKTTTFFLVPSISPPSLAARRTGRHAMIGRQDPQGNCVERRFFFRSCRRSKSNRRITTSSLAIRDIAGSYRSHQFSTSSILGRPSGHPRSGLAQRSELVKVGPRFGDPNGCGTPVAQVRVHLRLRTDHDLPAVVGT